MPKAINTFEGGIDRDTDKLRTKSNTYFDMSYFRITEGNDYYTITNQKGNSLLLSIPDITSNSYSGYQSSLPATINFTSSTSYTEANLKIIGFGNIRDTIVVFTTNDATTAGGIGQIWKLILNEDFTINTFELVYIADLSFSTQYPIIDSRGRYEHEQLQKIYWTDNNSILRYININSPTSLFDNTPSFTDHINDVTYSQPVLTSARQGGNFTSGVVQYAYSLYNLNGSQTKTSPATPLYNLSLQDKGASLDTNVGKSLEVNVPTVDTDFTHILVYRIFYNTIDGTPSISLIKDELVDSSYTFIDDGATSISSLSLEEFTFIGGDPIICKTLAEKDDVLFPGNIKYPKFNVDFDARAYRFSPPYQNPDGAPHLYRTARIEDSQGNLEQNIFGTNPSYPTDLTLDAINPDDINNLAKQNNYKYQADGITLGGEGPNVSYSFSIEQETIDDSRDNNFKFVDGQQTLHLQSKGFHRDETYRIGLEWRNNKGQTSFVNWIGDIRFPAMEDNDNSITYGSSTDFRTIAIDTTNEDIISNILKLDVSITLDQTTIDDNNITGVRLVRVKREENDKTILAQGIINSTLWNPFDTDFTSNMYNSMWYTKPNSEFPLSSLNGNVSDEAPTHIARNGYQTKTSLFKFTSPEINFKDNITYSQDNYFVSAALVNIFGFTNRIGVDGSNVLQPHTRTYIDPFVDDAGYGGEDEFCNSYFQKGQNLKTLLSSSLNKVTISDGKKVNQSYNDLHTIGGLNYRNYTKVVLTDPTDQKNLRCYSNSSFMAKSSFIPTGETNPRYPQVVSSDASDGLILSNYKQTVVNQYGGNSFNSRANNIYYPCSDFLSITTAGTYSLTGEGDTYIYMYDTLTTMFDNKNGNNEGNNDDYGFESAHEVLIFPVETSVDLSLRHDTYNSRINFNELETDVNNSFMLQETTSLGNTLFPSGHTIAGNTTDIQYAISYLANWTDLYLYNTVYSKHRDLQASFPKPLNFVSIDHFDTRFLNSLKKINGEHIDNWTLYLANNFIDLNNAQGAIQRAQILNDNIYFAQNYGYGALIINPRTSIQDQDGVAMEIGTGGTLHDFEYISTIRGVQHQQAFLASNNALYLLDSNSKKFTRFTSHDGNRDLSDIKGLNGYFKDNLLSNTDNPLLGTGISSYYDPEYQEVVFTVQRSGLKPYNVCYNEIINAFHFFNADTIPVSGYNNTSIIHTNNLSSIYLHSKGDYGNFFGTDTTSSITLIVNANNIDLKSFTNLEWFSEVLDTNLADLQETVTSIRIFNDYQDTGVITSPFKRLFREWSLTIPRDQNSRARIRNGWTYITLNFSNTSNKKITIRPITTHILQDIR